MSATVTMLPAAKANMIERLFLNFKIMNPPRSVDKNVIKAVMIAGFISTTGLMMFSGILNIIQRTLGNIGVRCCSVYR